MSDSAAAWAPDERTIAWVALRLHEIAWVALRLHEEARSHFDLWAFEFQGIDFEAVWHGIADRVARYGTEVQSAH